MNKFFIVLFFLISFVSVRAGELTCLCFEDTVSHLSSTKDTVQVVDHHNDSEADSGKDHTDHCQHTCSQCHFAALVPLIFSLRFPDSVPQSEPPSIVQIPREISVPLYRPPIA